MVRTDKGANQSLLAKVPPEAKLVQVIDAKTGKIKYKPVEEINDLDRIQTTKSGDPITMKGTPGRQPGSAKAVATTPTTRVAGELIAMKSESIAIDPILKVARANPEDPDVLHQVVLALGAEAASIAFERQQAELHGEKTSELSVRRIGALKAIADTWLKRKDQIASRGIDMASPAYRIFMREVLGAFREALSSSGARPELVETVFTKLSKIMSDDWEVEVRERIKRVV